MYSGKKGRDPLMVIGQDIVYVGVRYGIILLIFMLASLMLFLIHLQILHIGMYEAEMFGWYMLQQQLRIIYRTIYPNNFQYTALFILYYLHRYAELIGAMLAVILSKRLRGTKDPSVIQCFFFFFMLSAIAKITDLIIVHHLRFYHSLTHMIAHQSIVHDPSIGFDINPILFASSGCMLFFILLYITISLQLLKKRDLSRASLF